MASSSRVRIAYRVAGSTDPWSVLRRTNDGLSIGTETQRSEDVRDDRLRSGQKTTTVTVGGTLDFEFNAANLDIFIAAAMCADWATDVLNVGTTVKRFDILKSYMDTGDNFLFQDCVVGEMSLSMEAGQKVTGQLNFMGEGYDADYDATSDTFTQPTDTLFMDSSNNLGTFQIDGAPVTGMCFTAMSLAINNGYQTDQCLGELNQRHWVGSADITGSKTVRLSAAGLDLWRNTITSTPIASSWVLTDGDYSYTFDIGRLFLSGALPSGGLDTILTIPLDFVVAEDGNSTMLTITRTVPVAP